MRTMKRAAAVALSVVMLMTSGVTAKAAVTDAQPAKSGSEAVEKWATQISKGGDTLSEIEVVGQYVYAADDSQHRIIKINKTTGEIEKEHKYYNTGYTQYYAGNIGYGDGKIYVAYAFESSNGEKNTLGRIEAFDAETLEPVWISEPTSHTETDAKTGKSKTVNDEIASKMLYDNGHLYFGTGVLSGSGKYYELATKDDDSSRTDEIKSIKEITSSKGNYYLKKGIKAGQYVIISDTTGIITSIDTTNNDQIVDTKAIEEKFSGGITYDQITNTIYFVAGTNDLYGVKINDNGTFGETKKVRVYDSGYSSMIPEVYNGKVYVSGTTGTNAFASKGYLAVVDVKNYKVNYTVELPAYSQGEMLVAKTGENSVRLYFTVNYAEYDVDNSIKDGGGIYSIEDKEGATSAKLEKIYEPSKDYKQYCMNSIHIDENGVMYYTNDSRTIFAVGKKSSSDPVKPTQPTTETKPTTTTQTKPTTTTQTKPATKVKPITKTQTSTRSVKLTWKKKKSAKGYVIYAKAGKGKYKKLTIVGKTTKKTVTVKSGTSYKFKVKPYKYTKKKGKKVKKYYKAYAAKAKYGNKTVKVTYKNVKGYTSYRIDMKVGNGSYKKVLTSKKTGTLTLTYTQKKAKVGKSYKFRLVGIKTVNGKSVEKTIK